MPNPILKEIDRLAEQNTHDRTAEINGACRHWVEIGGVAGTDVSTQNVIAELSEEITNLKDQIAAMMDQMEQERTLLLKIIEGNEHTIKCLLATLPQNDLAAAKHSEKK
ncbi:MAG: hypothetical protein LBL85_05605 [Methanocalculaceae archaeon]|nr:hypothetical protein [Methanocalculaceae archaeon]